MKPVRVFRNLTKRCLSIQARLPGRGWRTIAHASKLSLSSPTFKVSEAGRLRGLKTGRKQVHAWVYGDLTRWDGAMVDAYVQDHRVNDILMLPGCDFCCDGDNVVFYRPYLRGDFMSHHATINPRATAPIVSADRVLMHGDGRMTCLKPRFKPSR
jgi:hypothetical protein